MYIRDHEISYIFLLLLMASCTKDEPLLDFYNSTSQRNGNISQFDHHQRGDHY